MTKPTDPLYANQWHLSQIGDLEKVWDYYTGNGVDVVVYDDGVEGTHPDLDDNYAPTGAFVFGGTTYSSSPTSTYGHGTCVAGLIAAEAFNGQGGVGVAWGATLASLNFLDSVQLQSDTVILAALNNAAKFDVMNNSWGYTPLYLAAQSLLVSGSASAQAAAAFQNVNATGRGGLGTIVVNAAGNEGMNANGEGMLASRHVIAVAAADRYGNVTDYSNWGANILVTAPAAAYTTDLTGPAGFNAAGTLDPDPLSNASYTSRFGGTSAATPVVSGVVALMLDANPDLGWRDVHNILALSASHTGSGLTSGPANNEIDGWQIANSGYWNGGGSGFSLDYGFGMVDALAAVGMAEVWTLMHGEVQTSANERQVSSSFSGYIAIPDLGSATAQTSVSQSIVAETVMVTVQLTHSYASDLKLTLIAPDGSEFVLIRNDADPDLMDFGFSWSFGVEGARGIDSAGTWRLRAEDLSQFDSGSIQGFSVDIYGSSNLGYKVHTFTDDFLLYNAVDSSRANIMSTSASDWLNFAGVTGNIVMTLAPGQTIRVAGQIWATLAGGTTFTRLATGSGNDTVRGSTGDDTVHVGIGRDVLYGRDGNDALFGGQSNDRLFGGAQNDTLDGGNGNDTVDGGNGRDLVRLGRGNDVFNDNGQNDAFGSDTVFGGAGNDQINGAGGHDVLRGEIGDDTVSGGVGDDTVFGGAGADVLVGGDGNDIVFGDDGRDRVYLGSGNDVFNDNSQNDVNGRDIVYGGAGDDRINGGGGNDEFYGKEGRDTILGGIGDDRLFGGSDFDTIKGGDGRDTVDGGFGRDLVFLGRGNDVFNDNGQDDAFGADTIFGGAGNDTIRAGGGADVIYGEAGNDMLTGGANADRFVFAAACGSDLVTDFTDDVDTLVFNAALWGGATLTESDVVTTYSAIVSGNAVFDFGGGNIVTLAGITNTSALIDDITIV